MVNQFLILGTLRLVILMLGNYKMRNWSKFFQRCHRSRTRSILDLTCWSLLSLTLNNSSVNSQIVPDNTLPSNSTVILDASIFLIDGGTKVGTNLFHSFQEFSLTTGSNAYFNNEIAIENILTRVTGSSISNIDGIISANGTANLFLINPNGIIFGENASLDVGGSFLGSTANSIVFQDGSDFNAVNPNSPPLLTINMPVGLNMGADAGEIIVEGIGNNIFYDFDFFVPVTSERPAGIQVNQGETIALIGNGVTLAGGNITAEQGRIELGSVNQEGIIGLSETENGWVANYDAIEGFSDLNLTDAASADASGNGGGVVQLVGRNISLIDGAVVLVETFGDGNGGLINVQATETVDLLRDNPETGFWTSLLADSVEGSTGTSGSITVESKNLNLIDGGQITSVIYGDGDGGDINIKAEEVVFDGFNEDEFGFLGTSGIFATAEFTAFGTSGNVNIEADELTVTNLAQIAALTWGGGNAGTINIEVDKVSLTDEGLIVAIAEEFSFGDAGNISVIAEELLLQDGGQIFSDTFGEGNAGQIYVQAGTFRAIGATDPFDDFATGVFSSSAPDIVFDDGTVVPTGNSGTVRIVADDFQMRNGAQIQSATSGAGDAGQVLVEAESISLEGFNARGNTAILSSATEGTGNGGTIQIVTDSLNLADGATISASNFSTRDPEITPGEGLAGEINIQAQSITLESSLSEEQSAISAATFNAGGGNINIVTNEILATDNSLVTASTRGEGSGGNIEIQAEKIDFSDRSIISSSTSDVGQGGGITLSSNLLQITSGAEVTTSSIGMGDAGNIIISSDTIQTNRGMVSATSSQSNGGSISLTGQSLQLRSQSTLSTSVTGGDGQGGSITADSNSILIDNSQISAATEGEGDGGQVSLNASELNLRDNAIVSSSTSSTGNGGEIVLSGDLLEITTDAQVTTSSIGTGQAGNITISSNTLQTNQGSIAATSEQSGGGDIKISSELLNLQNNSLLSTSVLDSNGGGGNISIESQTVLAKDNSDIRANAVEGPGGNINIATEVIFASFSSDIDASSQFGIDGVVEVTTPDSEKQITLSPLPQEVSDPNSLIQATCPVQDKNVLLVAGKGGLSENPQSYLVGQTVWQDVRFVTESPVSRAFGKYTAINGDSDRNNQFLTITEANSLMLNPSGNLQLVTALTSSSKPNSWYPASSCSNLSQK